MKKTNTVSVVMNTYNSAKTLEKALASISWADEIIVMDMGSTDQTVEIAKKAQVTFYTHPNAGYVEPARNAVISKAQSDWILVLDADEVIQPTLATKIQALANGDATVDAYFLPRKNMMFGDWLFLAGWWPDYQLRFFRKGVIDWPTAIHSTPIVTGTTDYLAPQDSLAIEHYNYTSIDEYLTRSIRYTSHEVDSRKTVDTNTTMLISSFKNELLRRLFLQKGISGGIRGVGLSLMQALYEIVVVLKTWKKRPTQHKEESEESIILELTVFRSELQYWLADWHVQHSSGINRFIWKIRRRMRI